MILVDTNIIIEAVRTGCWRALRGHYQMVTVGACVREAHSGKPGSRGYVGVSEEDLGERLYTRDVTERERAQLTVMCPEATVLDEGERDLLAHALSCPPDARIVSADKAAVRIAMHLGFGDRLVSLEELCEAGGIRPRLALHSHHTRRWLSEWRAKFHLGM